MPSFVNNVAIYNIQSFPRGISGQENKIKDYIDGEVKRLNISTFVEDVIVPTQKVIQIRNGKKVSKEKVYFPV